MSSDELKSLGAEIDALTSEVVCSLMPETQKYFWLDPNTGKISPNSSANDETIPIVGYINGQGDKEGLLKHLSSELYALQENGLLADSYVPVITCTDSGQSGSNVVSNFKNQSSGDQGMKNVYPGIPLLSDQEKKNFKEDLKRTDAGENLRAKLNKSVWLHVRMPSEFNYTGAMMVNHAFQGLLHSFLRHHDEWLTIIPDLFTIVDGLSAIKSYLTAIRSAHSPSDSRGALHNFTGFVEALDEATFITIQGLLIDAQMKIHDFIQENIIYLNYVGEGVNSNGYVQVYFKVRDRNGNPQIIAICPSKQLYPRDDSFGDSRPIRTITTVFSLTQQECDRRCLDKMFK